MKFTGDIGQWQRRAGESPEGVARRLAVFEALMPQPGMRILDIGCGGGHLLYELARAVGPAGRTVGIDLSEEQLEVARARCSELASVELFTADVCDLPMDDGAFDAATAVQTLEYVPDVDRALAETRRVLRTGGRVAFVSVLWDTFRFHGPDPVLNERITEAWRAHCPHQMLPAEMPARMLAAGLEAVNQRTLAFFNPSYHENCLSYWAAKLMAVFAVGQGVPKEDTETWLAQLAQADKDGRYGFVSVPVLTVGFAA